MDLIRTVRRFWRTLSGRDRVYLIGIAALMTLASVVEVIGLGTVPVFLGLLAQGDGAAGVPWLGSLIEATGLEGRRELLTAGGLAMIGVFAVQMVFLAGLAYLRACYQARLISGLSQRLFAGYLGAPFSYHADRHSSQISTRVVIETMRTVNNFANPLMRLMQSSLMALGIVLIVVVASSADSLLIMAGVAMVAGTVLVVMRRRAKAYGELFTRGNARVAEHVSEALGSLKHIRLRGLEERFSAAFRPDNQSRANAIGFQQFANELPKPIMEALAVGGMVTLVLTRSLDGAPLSEIIPMLGLLAAAVARVLPHINQITTSLLRMQQNMSAARTVLDDLEMLERQGPQAPDHRAETRAAEMVPEFATSLRFEGVSYAYPDAVNPSVHDLTLEIPKGASVAFVGGTGAGKSTVINLLTGLIEPDAGRILIDGVDLGRDRQAWQRRIGYIPQSVFLTNGTLRENVALGLSAEEIDDQRVHAVLRQAQLQEFTAELPDGLDSPVGENGVRLSGGQRQRIGIARALYHDPEVLVFDEATAALDNETERNLMAAIEEVRQNHTLVMIAHRLSSIRACDCIFVMEQGRLTGVGTYDELLAHNQTFQALAA